MTYNSKLLNFNFGLVSFVGSRNPFLSDPILLLVACTAFSFSFHVDSVRIECNLKKVWINLYFRIEFWLKWIDLCVFFCLFFLPKESSNLFELKIQHLKLYTHSFLYIKDKHTITAGFSIRIYLKLSIQILFSYENRKNFLK